MLNSQSRKYKDQMMGGHKKSGNIPLNDLTFKNSFKAVIRRKIPSRGRKEFRKKKMKSKVIRTVVTIVSLVRYCFVVTKVGKTQNVKNEALRSP